MGSVLTRHLRDLGDIGGFEASNISLPACSESCPAKPTDIQHPRVLEFDPRSPTAEIARTPIEVDSNISRRMAQDSPVSSVLHSRRSYLETDLDTLSTQEFSSKPDNLSVEGTPKQDSSLRPGLTGAHLMKLRFLGMDPRSPSSDVVRTPIQLGKDFKKDTAPFHFDDTLSVGSVSSQDLFNNSICSSDFTRDCSDPSAFISENEENSEKEEEHDISTKQVSCEKIISSSVKEEAANDSSALTNEKASVIVEGALKTSKNLVVYQENNAKAVQTDDKDSPITPEGAKKASSKRSRTPLTPIGNRNRTPNSILRAKHSKAIEREILTKAKILSSEENMLTPSKIWAYSNIQKENSHVGRSMHKGSSVTDENASVTAPKKHVLAQWDQDTSVVI